VTRTSRGQRRIEVERPWFTKQRWILVLLVVLPPIGAVLMWTVTRWAPTMKLALTVVAALWCAALVVGLSTNLETHDNSPDPVAPIVDDGRGPQSSP
jgi:cytochrome c biogenesis factor